MKITYAGVGVTLAALGVVFQHNALPVVRVVVLALLAVAWLLHIFGRGRLAWVTSAVFWFALVALGLLGHAEFGRWLAFIYAGLGVVSLGRAAELNGFDDYIGDGA